MCFCSWQPWVGPIRLSITPRGPDPPAAQSQLSHIALALLCCQPLYRGTVMVIPQDTVTAPLPCPVVAHGTPNPQMHSGCTVHQPQEELVGDLSSEHPIFRRCCPKVSSSSAFFRMGRVSPGTICRTYNWVGSLLGCPAVMSGLNSSRMPWHQWYVACYLSSLEHLDYCCSFLLAHWVWHGGAWMMRPVPSSYHLLFTPQVKSTPSWESYTGCSSEQSLPRWPLSPHSQHTGHLVLWCLAPDNCVPMEALYNCINMLPPCRIYVRCISFSDLNFVHSKLAVSWWKKWSIYVASCVSTAVLSPGSVCCLIHNVSTVLSLQGSHMWFNAEGLHCGVS
jgi:hypothetical protein